MEERRRHSDTGTSNSLWPRTYVQPRPGEAAHSLLHEVTWLRLLADSVPQIIWTNDGRGAANYFNKRWYEYTGCTHEESVGLGWQLVVHPDDERSATHKWHDSLEMGETLEVQYRLKSREGQYRWFIGRNIPVRDETGTVAGWFGTATDIEDLKGAQVALRESEARYRELAGDLSRTKEALLAADRQKDQFIATLAHELRNPLAPVRSAMQLISMNGSQNPQVLWALDIVNRQTNAMTRLIDDLMDVSRISQNKLLLRTDRVNLQTALRDAIDISRPLIDAQRHTLTLHLPDAPIELIGDQTRLSQIFANLLDNAGKYTTPGGAISLTATVDESTVTVRIADTGIGIAREDIDRIFALFAQVRTVGDRGKGGLGIGLSLVQQLVRMHRGTVMVHSDGSGHGSEFVVTLPLAKGNFHAIDASVTAPALDYSFPGIRMLVVDDNADAANSLEALLTRLGASVRTAYDGLTALQIAEEVLPHVILLDIGLPQLSGHQVAARIRQQPWGQQMILIAISGWGNEQEKRTSYEAGFDRHMVKPTEPARLMQAITDLLGAVE